MYEKYFSLSRKPFELIPNPEFLYPSRSHRKAENYLDYAVREKAGFILLTGEVGSGKTTLVRHLLRKIGSDVRISKVFNTKLKPEELIQTINEDFGLETEGRSKVHLLKDLNDFLIEQYAEGRRAILIIDEAQNLSPDSLEEVRMLSNLETDDSKLLQIILVGQPELKEVLSSPELRQLRQRISIHCHLQPLTLSETEEYILYRLEIAGDREAVIFSPGAMELVYRFSKGIPRLINIMCDFLLLSAFAEETRYITEDLVLEVAGDTQFEGQFHIENDLLLQKRYRAPEVESSPSAQPVSEKGDLNFEWNMEKGEKSAGSEEAETIYLDEKDIVFSPQDRRTPVREENIQEGFMSRIRRFFMQEIF